MIKQDEIEEFVRSLVISRNMQKQKQKKIFQLFPYNPCATILATNDAWAWTCSTIVDIRVTEAYKSVSNTGFRYLYILPTNLTHLDRLAPSHIDVYISLESEEVFVVSKNLGRFANFQT